MPGPLSDSLRAYGLDSLAAALDDSQPERSLPSNVYADVAPGFGGKVSYRPALGKNSNVLPSVPSAIDALSAGVDLPFRTLGNMAEARGASPALSTAAYAVPQFLSPGSLTKGTGAAVKALREVGPKMAGQFLDKSPLAQMALDPSYVVKPRGGNWMHYIQDGNLTPISGLNANLESIKRAVPIRNNTIMNAADSWVDKQLKRYLQTNWGTEQDPLADMLVRGELPEYGGGLIEDWLDRARTVTPPGGDLRDQFTFPTLDSLIKNSKDEVVLNPVHGGPAYQHKEHLVSQLERVGYLPDSNAELLKNPAWLDKLPPDTPLYDMKPSSFHDAMQDNIGRLFDYFNTLRPEQINNLSVPDAFRNSEAWHAQLAKKMTDDPVAAGGAELHKEYPDKFKWLKLNSDEALDAEGKMMGHCVGSYCDQVNSGNSQIYSLRDPQGRSHVTIEAKPNHIAAFDLLPQEEKDKLMQATYEKLTGQTATLEQLRDSAFRRPRDWVQTIEGLFRDAHPEAFNFSDIQQIKGKQNAAPIKDYLPYVQDFVKSGDWSRVGDIDNSGLIDLENPGNTYGWHHKATRDLGAQELSKLWSLAREKHGRYATPEEVTSVVDEHFPKNPTTGSRYAKGGLVAKVEAAAAQTEKPTKEQAQSGKYKKGEVKLPGLPTISIENPVGSIREGTTAEGKAWKTTMVHHYGEFDGPAGADGDKVDVFIGPDLKSKAAFVIHQVDSEGDFDEHKVMVGFKDEDAAKQGYLANYQKGWKGMGPIVELTIPELAKRLKLGDFKKILKLKAGGLVQGDYLHPQALEDLALYLSTGS